MPRPRFSEDEEAPFPLEYLSSASEASLENFEIRQLTHAANLDKEMKVMAKERDRAKVLADLAGLLRRHRPELMRAMGSHLETIKGEKIA